MRRSKVQMDALTESLMGFAPDESAKAVVAKPGGPQFDYGREVKDARAAYPELRTKLTLPESFRFSDGSGPFPPGPPPMPK